jgi:sporulation protein YlmC with PRC-barrel domain
MTRFPLHAKVECSDGAGGESVAAIVNLTTGTVTHFVVADRSFPRSVQRLVPIEQVEETRSREIRLRCSQDDLAGMRPFAEMELIETVEPGDDPNDPAFAPPLVTPTEITLLPVEVEHLLPGELAVRRGTRIAATDSDVGVLEELMLDPQSGNVTHLILQEGHLWGKREIALPLSSIDRVDEDTVYLKLDRKAVEDLPAIPVQ